MSIPLQQKVAVGKYILSKKLARVEKFALVLQLEPLFQCNLECGGCGKIQFPADILRQRLTRAAVHRRGRGMRSTDGFDRRR